MSRKEEIKESRKRDRERQREEHPRVPLSARSAPLPHSDSVKKKNEKTLTLAAKYESKKHV